MWDITFFSTMSVYGHQGQAMTRGGGSGSGATEGSVMRWPHARAFRRWLPKSTDCGRLWGVSWPAAGRGLGVNPAAAVRRSDPDATRFDASAPVAPQTPARRRQGSGAVSGSVRPWVLREAKSVAYRARISVMALRSFCGYSSTVIPPPNALLNTLRVPIGVSRCCQVPA